MTKSTLLPTEFTERRIFLIRGQKVILDKDLAWLYDVQTRDLNKAVRRNIERFPSDFMFQLTAEESQNLMFHFGTSSGAERHGTKSAHWGGVRKLPKAFTEQGVAMLSGMLKSKRAIQMNIAIMRAFVRLREILSTHRELAQKLGSTKMRMAIG